MRIPAAIKRQIGDRRGQSDDLGRSGAQVMLYEDMVLKIQPDSRWAVNEHRMTRYLQDKLPVARIIEEAHVNGWHYLLMTRLPGVNLCDSSILDDQVKLADLAADALRQMWAVNVKFCPSDRTLKQKFIEIEQCLRNGTITRETAMQAETYGPGGFDSPAQLFEWLVKHQPEEELVLSHGDFCLPNVLVAGRQITGFIDLGDAGLADKWLDIEKVLWSMWANSTGKFGGKCRRFDRKYLFDALGMPPDEEKLRYYSLLSELC